MDLCRSAHRPWLAAALHGYRLFDWEVLCTVSLFFEELFYLISVSEYRARG